MTNEGFIACLIEAIDEIAKRLGDLAPGSISAQVRQYLVGLLSNNTRVLNHWRPQPYDRDDFDPNANNGRA